MTTDRTLPRTTTPFVTFFSTAALATYVPLRIDAKDTKTAAPMQQDIKQTLLVDAPKAIAAIMLAPIKKEDLAAKHVLATQKIIDECQTESLKAKKALQEKKQDAKSSLSPEVQTALNYADREAVRQLKYLKERTEIYMKMASRSNAIGLLCLELLNQARPNKVSHALESLDKTDRDNLILAWANSDDVRFQLLALYFSPFKLLPRDNTHALRIIFKQQCEKASPDLPKYLLPAVRARIEVTESKTPSCLPLLTDKNNPLWHLNMEGVEAKSLTSCEGWQIPGANFSYTDFGNYERDSTLTINFQNADISHGYFYRTKGYRINFKGTKTDDCDFRGLFIDPTAPDYDGYGRKLQGLTDTQIKSFFEKEATAAYWEPLHTYFSSHTSPAGCFGSEKTQAPRSEYLLALCLLDTENQLIYHDHQGTFWVTNTELHRQPRDHYGDSRCPLFYARRINISLEFINAYYEYKKLFYASTHQEVVRPNAPTKPVSGGHNAPAHPTKEERSLKMSK